MSNKSYQRLLKVRHSALSRTRMTSFDALALDATLQMPHPLREESFLKWCLCSNNISDTKSTSAEPLPPAFLD